jgi:hypothetical protein
MNLTAKDVQKGLLILGIIFAAATAIWKTYELFEE